MGLFFLSKKTQKNIQLRTKSVQPTSSMSDIFFDSKQRFISLQKKYWIIKQKYFSLAINKEPFQFLSERKETLRRCAIFLLVIFCLGFFSPFTSAHVSTFYPTTCLGGWEHPEHATGEPSLDKKSNAQEYTLGNSARLKETTSPLYCGGFTGAIPQNTKPTTFKVSFAWTVDDGSVVHDEAQSTENTQPTTIPSSASESTTPLELVPTGNNTSSEAEVIQVENQSSGGENTTSESSENNFTPASESAPASESSSESTSPLSFFRDLLPSVVFAQETDVPASTPAPEVESSVDATSLSSEIALPIEQVINLTDIPASTTSPTSMVVDHGKTLPVFDTTSEVPFDAFLEVDYTLDGTTWNTLGVVTRSAWKNASFDIPLQAWENLDHLQISLKSLPTFDQSPVVYLDSMALTVEYDAIKEELAPPTVILKDESSLISGKTDFTSSDEVEFSVSNPSLDVQDLKNLVTDGTAEVVEDVSGVLDTSVVKLGEEQIRTSPVETIKEIFQPVFDQVQQSNSTTTSMPIEYSLVPVIPLSPESSLEMIQIAESQKPILIPIPEKSPIPRESVVVDPSPLSFAPLIPVAHAKEVEVPDMTAVVFDIHGEETTINTHIVTVLVGGVEKQRIHIDRPEREFKPGRYTLKVTLNTASAILVSTQDFTWGVLAINTDKSMYQGGDDAYVQMGVLNDNGHTLCHADLELSIKSPSGTTTHFTTDDNSIVRDERCGPDNVIDVPDYYSHYRVPSDAGSYEMTLTAVTANGTKKIVDHFTVQETPAFDVRRKGPTRIYPVANYPMTLFVTSPVDWSGTITERVPVNFGISQPVHSLNYESVETIGDEQIITWNVDLEAGQKTALGYIFDAPNISPEFYLLGPLEFQTNSGGSPVFSESRNWQIASDAACNATATGTWGGTDTANFTNCTGAASGGSGTGLRPGTGDVLTINAGVTVTVAANVSVGDITIANPTTANGISINTTFTLTVTTSGGGGGAITYTANTQANAQTITMNGTGGVTAVSLTIPAPTSTGASDFTCASSATGTFTVGTVSITGNSTTTGAVTVKMLTCTLSASGLVTITGGSNATGSANLTASTGTLTMSAGLTFAGTSTTAKLTTTGAATINITGTISSGGTISFNSALSATNFTGTSAINGAYTFRAVNVNSGTLTLGAGTITFSTGQSGAVGTTIANGATLSLGNFAWNGTASITIGGGTSGTLNVAGAGSTGSYVFASGITVNAGGVLDLSTGTHSTSVSGSQTWTHNGATWNFGTGAFSMSSSSLILSGGSAMTFGGTTTINASGNMTNSNTNTVTIAAMTLANPSGGSNSFTASTGSTTSITGAISYTANVTSNTQTTTMNGTANISAGSLTINTPTSTGASNFTCASSATGTFSTSGAVSITGNSTNTGAVTMEMLTCTLSVGGLLTITGGSNGTGVAKITSSTGTITTSAGITFAGTAANAQLTTTGAGTHNFTGTLSSGGTVSYDSSTTLKFTGTCSITNNSYTYPIVEVNSGTTTVGSGTKTFGAITVASSSTLQLGTGAGTFNSTISVTGSLTADTGSTAYNFNGAFTVNSGGIVDFTAGTHTIALSSGTQTMNGTTWNTGTGAITWGGSATLAGSSAMTFGGAMTIAAGQTVTNSNTNTVTIASVTINSASTANGMSLTTASTTSVTGAITYTANANTSAQTITMNGTANITAGSLTINAPTSTGASNFTCASSATGTFTVSGALAITGNSTSTGASSMDMLTCTLSVGSTTTITGGTNGTGVAKITSSTGTITTSAGITFAGTAANAQLTTTGAGTWNNTGTISSGGTISLNSSTTTKFTGTSAVNDAYTFTIVQVNSGTTTLGAGTITFSGTLLVANGATLSLGNFAFTQTGAVTIGSGTSGTISVAGAGSTGTYTFSGNITVNAGGICDVSTGTHATSFGGNIAHSGTTFNAGTGATTLSATLAFSGSSSMTFGGAVTINSGFTVTNSNSATVNFLSSVTGGNGSSNFATDINSTTKFGGSVMSTGIVTPSTSTNSIEYNGTTQTIKAPSTNPYYNLKVSASGTKSLAANTVVTDTLTVSAGTLDTTGSNFTITTNDLTIGASGTLLGNGSTITLTRNWSNSGAFTAGTSTILLNGGTTATVSGTTTFYNVTITHTSTKQVNFTTSGSPVFTITHTFTSTGTSGQPMVLLSDSSGTQWHFLPTGTATVDYTNTQDSACDSGAVQVTRTNFTNLGNNGLCWSDASITFDISDSSIGFGTLTTSNARWATGDTLGSASDVSAHTMTISTTAVGGYVLSYIGALPTSGSNTIAAASITNDADGTPGTAAFGLGISTAGSSTIASGYDHNATAGLRDWSFVPSISTSIISNSGAVSTPEVISTYYLGNISSTTASGSYTTSVTYLLTGTF